MPIKLLKNWNDYIIFFYKKKSWNKLQKRARNIFKSKNKRIGKSLHGIVSQCSSICRKAVEFVEKAKRRICFCKIFQSSVIWFFFLDIFRWKMSLNCKQIILPEMFNVLSTIFNIHILKQTQRADQNKLTLQAF